MTLQEPTMFKIRDLMSMIFKLKTQNTGDKIICQRNFEGDFSREPTSRVLKTEIKS